VPQKQLKALLKRLPRLLKALLMQQQKRPKLQQRKLRKRLTTLLKRQPKLLMPRQKKRPKLLKL